MPHNKTTAQGIQTPVEHRKESGLVFPFSETSLSRWRRKVHKKAEVTSIQDGARHSFATFHLALNPMEDTMQELGHTTSQMLFRHYRGLAKNRKVKANEYFLIVPKNEQFRFKKLCIDLAS